MREEKVTIKNCPQAFYWGMVILVVMLVTTVGWVVADETDNRRIDISLSIFPRIVAVDNQFREKLDADKKAYLLFVYDKDDKYASELVDRVQKNNANIGGMYVAAKAVSIADDLVEGSPPTAMFIVEKLDDAQLKKVMAFSNKTNRLLFSPFSGDVERGVTVGISVTNRVKPYFNLTSLRESKVSINALLMKMSKRHE